MTFPEKLNRFLTLCREKGSIHAVLTAIAYLSPTPVSFRIKSARKVYEFPKDLSLRTKYSMWRNGFYPKSYALYDFENYRPDEYVSDFNEEYCWEINKPHDDYLNNKQKFYELLEETGFDNFLPGRFGCISDGGIDAVDTEIVSLLQEKGKLVIKRETGAAGKHVYICEHDGSGLKINETKHSEDEFRERLSDFDGYLVTEFCEQASYINTIFPGTPNTIRMVTMNPQNGDPFVARAVHRIGSQSSGAVDNFSQGGLSAKIDQDGTLGPAVQYNNGEVSWHDVHPDTKSQISGIQVPMWDEACDTILSIIQKNPELKYVGWDIIVTDGGFRIIEGNSNTDTDLLQAHGPLLIDDRIQAFYQEQDIVS